MPKEIGSLEKHEKILAMRSELCEQMESGREGLNTQRKHRDKEREAALHRNNTLLQDLQTLEHRLRGRQLPHPNVQALETRYWASVEESLPAWEHFLLGKGPHPTDDLGQPSRRAKHRAAPARDRGLPPRPKARPAQ